MVMALRGMPGNNYADLVFQQACLTREAKGGKGGQEVLENATRVDAEQMLCYMRWLDRDCDGYISEKDFGAVCNVMADPDGPAIMLKRWQAADVKVEKPSLKMGARGVLDKLGKLGGGLLPKVVEPKVDADA